MSELQMLKEKGVICWQHIYAYQLTPLCGRGKAYSYWCSAITIFSHRASNAA